MAVSDGEILAALAELPRRSGVFAEPAAAAAYAGFVKMAREGRLQASDRIAVIVSGNGLKDVVAAQEAVSPARKIAPDMAALESALEFGNP